jgi:hypothetical protein
MIERIYIPTIRRSDIQITYENLPEELQKRVIMVVEPAERHLYKYDCEYLELPKEIVGSWTQLSETRKFIHNHAGTIKYAMADDDIIIYKRNKKYFGELPDMDTSKRKATSDEILKLFDMVSEWLDDSEIGIVGLTEQRIPPASKKYTDTTGAYSFIILDGKKISKVVDELDTSIRVAEDLFFLFLCLSKGINSRVTNEFLFANKSFSKELKGKRPIWEEISKKSENIFQAKAHYDALRYIQEKFPGCISIFEKDGIMKNVKHWKKAYKKLNSDTLDIFFI